MNVTLVEINIKPERVDEFLEVFRANHEGALQEPGNLRFDVLQDPEVKTRFFIYEAYIDDDAVLAHKKTPHYLACVAKLEALMSQPRLLMLDEPSLGLAPLIVAEILADPELRPLAERAAAERGDVTYLGALDRAGMAAARTASTSASTAITTLGC